MLPGPLPEPAGQRQPGHRGGHGHQHPAAQPGRGHRRHHATCSTTPRPPPTTSWQFVKGPDFPTGALIMGRQGIIDAYRTGRGSIKLRGKAEIEEGPRSDRIVVTELPVPGRARTSSSSKVAELVDARELEGIADLNDESAKGETRLVHRAQARRAGARHPQQPLQAHPAADELRGQHGGPGRRRAPHAQPARRAAWPTSTTRSRSSAAAREFRLDKAQRPGPHRRGPPQGARPDRRDHRRHPGSRRQAGGPRRRSWPTPFEFCEVQAEHILDMQLSPPHPPGPRPASRRRWPQLRETIAELEAILGDEVKLRARHQRRRWPRSATSTPSPAARRSPTTSGDLDIEDLIDDEDLVVTMTRQGLHQDRRRRRLPHPGPRRSRRGRRQAQGRGLRHPHHPHHGPRLPAVLLEPRPGLPAQGARDPDEGAHGARHRHRQPAAAAAGRARSRRSSTPATTRPTGTCSSPPGRARSRRPSSPSTTRRCGPASSPSTCATATSWCGSSPPTAATTSSWCPERA